MKLQKILFGEVEPKIRLVYLAEIISSSALKDSYRYFRAFDFQEKNGKNKALLSLLKKSKSEELSLLIFKHFDAESIVKDAEFNAILPRVLDNIKNDVDFIDIVAEIWTSKTKELDLDNILLGSTNPRSL